MFNGLEGLGEIILGIQNFMEKTPGLREARTEKEFMKLAKKELAMRIKKGKKARRKK